MFQELYSATVFGKTFLFFAESSRMGLPAATGKAHGVFDMEHFVVKDVADNISRHIGPVELATHNDLAQGRIEAAKLCAPCSPAPGQARRCEGSIEILAIQAVKQQLEIMVPSGGAVFHPPPAEPAQPKKPPACRVGIGKMAVCFEQFSRRAPSIKPAQQNRGHRLDDYARGASQSIREPDIRGIVPQPDRMGEI
jgi:hypothetical protein